MKLNKLILSILLFTSVLALGGCSDMNKALDAIKGQDGVFAVMETSNGVIAIKLHYKETPLTVTNFVRFEVGEGMEKKNEDFAAEVAAQLG